MCGLHLRRTVAGFRGPAALLEHVLDVVALRAEREVFDANAGRVVAGVQENQTVRDGAVDQLPCDAVDVLESAVDQHPRVTHRVVLRSGPDAALAVVLATQPDSLSSGQSFGGLDDVDVAMPPLPEVVLVAESGGLDWVVAVFDRAWSAA